MPGRRALKFSTANYEAWALKVILSRFYRLPSSQPASVRQPSSQSSP
jgi:hypothetical protein